MLQVWLIITGGQPPSWDGIARLPPAPAAEEGSAIDENRLARRAVFTSHDRSTNGHGQASAHMRAGLPMATLTGIVTTPDQAPSQTQD